ncbi:MAG: alpha/beta hydrolase [Cyclobacteriaceae bacterium]|nr:alpha/beta hydrolase [Cyclobacteriaceae bacterium]
MINVFALVFTLLSSVQSIQIFEECAVENEFEHVKFTTIDGGQIEGALFEAGKERVVLFAHGAVFNKESWYFLCEELKRKGLSSLSIDFRGYGNSEKGSSDQKYYDVLGAIEYLKEQGYKKIAIVGGSMGGGAVLRALEVEVDKKVDKVVLLAAAGGQPIMNKNVEKLFVVSKEEKAYERVVKLHEESAEPKTLKVYPGSSHAQHMFKTEHRDDLVRLIILKVADE